MEFHVLNIKLFLYLSDMLCQNVHDRFEIKGAVVTGFLSTILLFGLSYAATLRLLGGVLWGS